MRPWLNRIEHRPSKPTVAGSSPAGRASPRRILNMKSKPRNGGRSSVGRAPDCGSGGRGFKSHRSPQKLNFGPLAQLVEQQTLNLSVRGSSPWRPTKFALCRARSLFLSCV